jgi:hypothetical protein
MKKELLWAQCRNNESTQQYMELIEDAVFWDVALCGFFV